MYDIGAISTNLRISVLQSEEESEKIADEFLQGKSTKRKVYTLNINSKFCNLSSLFLDF